MSNEITASAQVKELSNEELDAVAGGTSFGTVRDILGSSIGDGSNNSVINNPPSFEPSAE
jgi:bacteriocin-like protein